MGGTGLSLSCFRKWTVRQQCFPPSTVWRAPWTGPRSNANRLSKIDDYLEGNVLSLRLSTVRLAGQRKKDCPILRVEGMAPTLSANGAEKGTRLVSSRTPQPSQTLTETASWMLPVTNELGFGNDGSVMVFFGNGAGDI
jgi:hypothetical protein